MSRGAHPQAHSAVMAEDIEELRRKRVAELIRTKFEGRQIDFARAIGRDPTYVSRMLRLPGDPHRRAIAEDMASHIEQTLGLPTGYMRTP
jgi:plasmid maintenance system antidote protein VapI